MENKITIKDIKKAIDEIASIPFSSGYYYYFSEKFIKENPQYFYKIDDTWYFISDNTEVKILPTALQLDNLNETVYIVPAEKPIKFAFEGEK